MEILNTDQISNGIPYVPGNDPIKLSMKKNSEPDAIHNKIMREVFMSILGVSIPVVVHNGLLDLMFMYNSFYADLPSDLPVFLADSSLMFKGGIYDTKYISDFITREPKSFLSYLYRKYERLNSRNGDGFTLECSLELKHKLSRCKLTLAQLGLAPKQPKTILDTGKPFCEQYAAHGFCYSGNDCKESHDLDLILDYDLETEELIKSRANKRQKIVAQGDLKSVVSSAFETYHSACFGTIWYLTQTLT